MVPLERTWYLLEETCIGENLSISVLGNRLKSFLQSGIFGMSRNFVPVLVFSNEGLSFFRQDERTVWTRSCVFDPRILIVVPIANVQLTSVANHPVVYASVEESGFSHFPFI